MEETREFKSEPVRPRRGYGRGTQERIYLRPAAVFAVGVWRDLLNQRPDPETGEVAPYPTVYLDRIPQASTDPVYAHLIAYATDLAAREQNVNAHDFETARLLMQEQDRITE